jgi:hypothetical protein
MECEGWTSENDERAAGFCSVTLGKFLLLALDRFRRLEDEIDAKACAVLTLGSMDT